MLTILCGCVRLGNVEIGRIELRESEQNFLKSRFDPCAQLELKLA